MVKARRYGAYSAAPLASGRASRRRRYWLRTARLNAVGWAAVLVVVGVTAAIGIVLARAIGLPGWSGAVLGLLPLGTMVHADRRRWGRMESGFGWGGSVAEVERIAEQLRAAGITARAEPDHSEPSHPEPYHREPWADPAMPPPDVPEEATASLVYRNGDTERVRAILRGHGLELPDLWW